MLFGELNRSNKSSSVLGSSFLSIILDSRSIQQLASAVASWGFELVGKLYALIASPSFCFLSFQIVGYKSIEYLYNSGSSK
jgi:hypothetical protein